MTHDSEQEVAKPVVRWLQGEGWTVYQEVATGYGNPVADIVAVSGNLSWIVECKRSRTLALVDQARAWLGWASFVSVATPVVSRRATLRLRCAPTWHDLLDHFGLGEFEVGETAHHRLAPRVFRKRLSSARIENFLRDEQRSGEYAAAGSNHGGHWTAYRNTCRALAAWAKEHDGGTLREAVEAIEHHYATNSSARSTLRRWIAAGKVPGVRFSAGRIYAEPAEAKV